MAVCEIEEFKAMTDDTDNEMDPSGRAIVGFDPEHMGLDLTKEEKVRTTALMLAINYHVDTIIRETGMLRYQTDRGMEVTPTTARRVVEIADTFAAWITSGKLEVVHERDNHGPDEERAQSASQASD